MSLQVWLPFTENTENQGLNLAATANRTVNGYTQSAMGKLGKAYAGYSIYHLSSDFLDNTWSLATWFSSSSFGPYNNIILCKNNTSSTDCHIYWSVISNNSFNIGINGPSGTTSYSYTFATDTWYHLATTYDGANIKMYINGALVKDVAYTSTKAEGKMNLGIGCRSQTEAGGSPTGIWSAKYNDFRIYDHCLSQAEIYELAKAKLIHLKLSDNYNTITNVFNYPTFNNSAASAGWNHWGPSGHSGTYGQNTDKKYIFDKTQTYSHWVAEGHAVGTANMYYICYQSPAFEGGYRSVQFILKEQNGIPITDSVCIPNWNGVVSGSIPKKWTSIISLGDGFYLCKCEGFQQTGSDDLVSILVFPGYKVYISQAVCEDNKQICGDIFRQGDLTNIYDCSGYRHDAIQNALTSSLDTARYESSAIFNGSSSYVKINDTTWMADRMPAMTINLWAKNSTWNANTHFFSCTEGGGFNTETGNSGYLRFPISVYTAETGTSYAYKYDSQELKLSDIPTDEWVMLTWVYDNFGTRTYINGELHHTYINNSYGIHFNTGARLFLGCEANAANPSSPWYNGQMSDFRIYATAMSQADIRLLYRTSGFVDDQGNVFAGELREV